MPEIKQYPFLYINHGEINTDSIGKCEELWLWFDTDISKTDRREIERNCPLPVSDFMGWDARFAYFGSPGDVYDCEIINTYGPKEIIEKMNEALDDQNYREFSNYNEQAMEKMPEAAQAFNRDLEKWILEVHNRFPIKVFFGPQGGGSEEGDDWNRYSLRRFAKTMRPLLTSYKPSREGKTYFDYIKSVANEFIGDYADEMDIGETGATDSLLAAEREYEEIWFPVPFERLMSDSDAPIQHLGSTVKNILDTRPQSERKGLLEKLSPYARLCYFASYSASKAKDMERFGNMAEYIRELALQVPKDRQYCASWLAIYAAETLAQDSCAFDSKKRDISAIDQAAAIAEVAMDLSGNVSYMWGKAVRYLAWSGLSERAIAVAREGLKRHPYDKFILGEVKHAIKDCKDKQAEKEFDAILERANQYDPNVFVNETNNLAGQKKLKEMVELLENHLAAGAQVTGPVINNGLFPFLNGIKPSENFQKNIFPELLKTALSRSDIRQSAEGIVQLGVTLDKMIEHRKLFLELALPSLGEHSAALHSQMFWHALASNNDDITKKIMSRIDEILAVDPEYLDRQTYTLTNLACMACQFGERERALSYIEMLRSADHKRFLTLHRDEDVKILWDSSEFESLYSEDPEGKDEEDFD